MSDLTDKKIPYGEKTDHVPTLELGNYRAEDGVNAFDQREGEELKHSLLPRHLAMISIGGVIGEYAVSANKRVILHVDSSVPRTQAPVFSSVRVTLCVPVVRSVSGSPTASWAPSASA